MARKLTDKELETAMWVRYGKTNKEIAQLRGVSEGSARNILARLVEKLGFGGNNSRVKVATWWVEQEKKGKDKR